LKRNLVVSFVDLVEDKGVKLKESENNLGKVFGGLVRGES